MGTAGLQPDGRAVLPAEKHDRLAKDHPPHRLAPDLVVIGSDVPEISQEHGRSSLGGILAVMELSMQRRERVLSARACPSSPISVPVAAPSLKSPISCRSEVRGVGGTTHMTKTTKRNTKTKATNTRAAPTKSQKTKAGAKPRKTEAVTTTSADQERRKAQVADRPPAVANAPVAGPAGRSHGRQSAETMLTELRRRLMEISDLNFAGAVLSWDQATYMPVAGAAARGRQTAMLSKLAHEKSVDPALGRLLDALEPYGEGLPYESDDASLIRVVRRDFEKAIRLPSDYVERASAHSSTSYVAWTKARPANDFAAMRPYLEKNVELSREYAGYFAPYERVTDPMIDDYDAGMTTASVLALFAALRRELVPIVRAICDQPAADDSCLRGAFAETKQLDLSISVAKRLGYAFDRGRNEKITQPFSSALLLA